MGAYNLYKNEHNCHNQWTLNKILKGDWKYDGVVVSDWGGAHDLEQSVKNGLDMEFGTWTDGLTMALPMPTTTIISMPYMKAIQEGKFTQKELDDKVRRVLRLFYRTTMNRNRPHGFLCSESHYAAARQIAEGRHRIAPEQEQCAPINTQKAKHTGSGRECHQDDDRRRRLFFAQGTARDFASRWPEDALGQGRHRGDYARGYVGDVTGNYNGVTTGQNLGRQAQRG